MSRAWDGKQVRLVFLSASFFLLCAAVPGTRERGYLILPVIPLYSTLSGILAASLAFWALFAVFWGIVPVVGCALVFSVVGLALRNRNAVRQGCSVLVTIGILVLGLYVSVYCVARVADLVRSKRAYASATARQAARTRS